MSCSVSVAFAPQYSMHLVVRWFHLTLSVSVVLFVYSLACVCALICNIQTTSLIECGKLMHNISNNKNSHSHSFTSSGSHKMCTVKRLTNREKKMCTLCRTITGWWTNNWPGSRLNVWICIRLSYYMQFHHAFCLSTLGSEPFFISSLTLALNHPIHMPCVKRCCYYTRGILHSHVKPETIE